MINIKLYKQRCCFFFSPVTIWVPHCWKKRVREHTHYPLQVINVLTSLESSVKIINKTCLTAVALGFFHHYPFNHFQQHLNKINHFLIMLFGCWCWHDIRPQDKKILSTSLAGAYKCCFTWTCWTQSCSSFGPTCLGNTSRVATCKLHLKAPFAFRATTFMEIKQMSKSKFFKCSCNRKPWIGVLAVLQSGTTKEGFPSLSYG